MQALVRRMLGPALAITALSLSATAASAILLQEKNAQVFGSLRRPRLCRRVLRP